MGRVKTRNIKRVGEDLLEQYPDEFSEDFEQNKKKVGELTTVQGKWLRNRIAGYVCALKKKVVD